MQNLLKVLVAIAAVATVSATATRRASAACNLIPGTAKTFNATLGATNRPYAAPGEQLELRRRFCDAGSGFLPDADDHVVTFAFKPSPGATRIVVLAADCAKVKLAACSSAPGVLSATCRQVAPGDLQLRTDVDLGDRRLVVRFPDTDDLLPPADDDATLAGPVAIAVTAASAAPACGLATGSCATQSGVIACVDELYANDGACGTTALDRRFPHFTALPPPNDFQADCFREDPPCTATAVSTRAAVDSAGNLLLPMGWGGVLVRDGDVPVPRLIRARIGAPLPIAVPGQVFLHSFTPEGGLLPPILEPQLDPTAAAPDVVTFFGSVDAPYTIIQRRQPPRHVRRRRRGRRALHDRPRLQRRRVRHLLRGSAGDDVHRSTPTVRAARADGCSTSRRWCRAAVRWCCRGALMGATNPANAAPGTVRAEFAELVGENSVHGSDAPETAAQEIAYFFAGIEIVG